MNFLIILYSFYSTERERVNFLPGSTMLAFAQLPSIHAVLIAVAVTGLRAAGAAWVSGPPNPYEFTTVTYSDAAVRGAKGRRSTSLTALFTVMAAVLAVGFVVMRCFAALNSRTFTTYDGISARRLAGTPGDSCGVSL